MVQLAGAQGMWDLPAMLDSPTGVLSFWAYIPTASGSPPFDDFYHLSGGFADPLSAPNESSLFMEPSFGGRVTFNKITGITSAAQAVISFAGDLTAVPAVGSTLNLWITNNVAPWYSATAWELTVVSHTSNTITVNWNTSGFAAYNPATYPNTFFDLAYVTSITRATQAVITTAIPHGIDGSSGNVWVKVGGLLQSAWSGIDFLIARVVSTTSTTLTLAYDTSAISSAFDPTQNDVKIYVYNAVEVFLANADQSLFYSYRTTMPLPQAALTNVKMSWDMNQAAGAKKFSMFFGATEVPAYYVQDYLAAFSVALSAASSGATNAWKIFGRGDTTDNSGFGYVGEYYWNASAPYMDFSLPANDAKFRNTTTNQAIDLGPDGSYPTGSKPTEYLSLRSDAILPPVPLGWWEPNGQNLVQSPGTLGGIADSSTMVLSFWLDRNTSGNQMIQAPGITVSWNNETAPFTTDVVLNDAGFAHVFEFTFPYDGARGVNVRIAVDAGHAIGSKLVTAYVGTQKQTVTVVQDTGANLAIRWQDGVTAFNLLNGVTGWIADIWFGPGQYFDISSQFVDADGNPLDLGAHGEVPSGTAPAVYAHLNGGQATSDLNTNLGTGGNFTGGQNMLSQNGTRFLDNRAGSGDLRLATGPLLIAPVTLPQYCPPPPYPPASLPPPTVPTAGVLQQIGCPP